MAARLHLHPNDLRGYHGRIRVDGTVSIVRTSRPGSERIGETSDAGFVSVDGATARGDFQVELRALASDSQRRLELRVWPSGDDRPCDALVVLEDEDPASWYSRAPPASWL